jgi:hypothetical protein
VTVGRLAALKIAAHFDPARGVNCEVWVADLLQVL